MTYFEECLTKQSNGKRTKVGEWTIGDLIGAVLKIDNPEDARRFYESYVASELDAGSDRERSIDIVKSNIGWCFGEGMSSDRIKMWREVCGAAHPVFGSMETPPTAKEAFDAGVAKGKAGKR